LSYDPATAVLRANAQAVDMCLFCSYSKACELSSVQTKDAANPTKHGVSLSIAGVLDWEAALVWVDERSEYGETRMIALAPETRTLYYVAFVDRGEVRRVISLRRANRREVKYYVENL
jgi:uncharacterized DUF497 family protein